MADEKVGAVKVSACGTAELHYTKFKTVRTGNDVMPIELDIVSNETICEPAHPAAIQKEAYAKMALQLLFEDKCKQLSCSAWKFLDGPRIKKEEIKAPQTLFLPFRPKL